MYTPVSNMKNVNSDVAYEFIRKRILNGNFPPGYPLMTQELSAEIGVSRTPIRDSLRQLEADGLVAIKSRMGASVRTMDLKEYSEMCGLRLALEVYAAGLAAEKRSLDELHEIEDCLKAMDRLTEASTESEVDDRDIVKALRQEDVRFHVAIITSAKSDLLKKEVLRLHIINRVVSGLKSAEPGGGRTTDERNIHRRTVQKSHVAIFRAIEKGDSAGAREAMENHLRDVVDSTIRLRMREERMAVPRDLTEEELSYMV